MPAHVAAATNLVSAQVADGKIKLQVTKANNKELTAKVNYVALC